ncbi:radical SAM domain-containing protein [Bacillus phage TsarBomba]|uniref:Uncharacterized protein n=1 Tax=Bacillus phage TsarBomba TaxID=1690456 RepID=A0A0K2D018_9CAUD|nr:radical SAM domain-containing protein [Bacillus phage TsarBomba]ALA13090.1 hypothetical protein TSARBOMBA_250 [Bacillus phage TsarBomba]
MSNQKEPIVGHLVVQDNPQSFLEKTTQAIKDYTAQGYELETHYQMIHNLQGGVTHSAYIVGKLKTTPELAPTIDYVRKQFVCGDMPEAVYKVLMELIINNIKK